MSDDLLVDVELEGLGPPWNFTSFERQWEAAKELPVNRVNIAETFAVLERCRRWMVNHPHAPSSMEGAWRMSLSKQVEDAGLLWFRLLSDLMPTLDDVSVDVVEAAATQPYPEIPGGEPPPTFLPMLARAWAWSFGRNLAETAIEWLFKYVQQSSDASARERYLELLTAIVPYACEVDDTVYISRIISLAYIDAIPYLERIAKHSETLEQARYKAEDRIEYLERMGYPGGEQWPAELWHLRGKRLANVMRTCLSYHGGPCKDQGLEFTFDDGTVLTIAAGEWILFYDPEPFGTTPESEVDPDEGFFYAELLAKNVIKNRTYDTDRYPVSEAIGRRIIHISSQDIEDGVIISFEQVRVSIGIIRPLAVNITWEVVDAQEP